MALTPAELHWTSEGVPYAPAFDDIYFHRGSGLEETRYVFLAGNDLPARWQHADNFTIAETGFGTGLNFLCAWQAWQAAAPPSARLHFISIEKFPLHADDLHRAHTVWPELAPFATQLHAAWPPLTAGKHTLSFADGCVTLTLLFGDITETLPQIDRPVDVWFLDGFAPGKNPEMWSAQLFQHMSDHTAPNGSFSTFTAASLVRKGLEAAGFHVEKQPGFAQKRHMLRGHRTPPRRAAKTQRAIIIGAGLAGTAAAYYLTRAGWQVTLIDRAATIAAEASGNPAALVMPWLTADHAPASQFYLHAFLHARADMHRLANITGEWHGITHLPSTRFPTARLQAIAEHLQIREALTLEWDGQRLHYHDAGWIDPASLCRAYASAEMALLLATHVASLQKKGDVWEAVDATGTVLAVAETVIIASAYEALQFAPTATLPLHRNRGQITYLPAAAVPTMPNGPLCYDGYAIPQAGELIIGATFDKKNADRNLREADHWHNIRALEAATGMQVALTSGQIAALPGRVAFRTTSPDHLPMIGSIPGHEGLYVSLAHGARGTVSAPLAGCLLAAMLTGEALPIPEEAVARVGVERLKHHSHTLLS